MMSSDVQQSTAEQSNAEPEEASIEILRERVQSLQAEKNAREQERIKEVENQCLRERLRGLIGLVIGGVLGYSIGTGIQQRKEADTQERVDTAIRRTLEEMETEKTSDSQNQNETDR